MADINEIVSQDAIGGLKEVINALMTVNEQLKEAKKYESVLNSISKSQGDAATKAKALTDAQKEQDKALKDLNKQREQAEKALQKQLQKEAEYEQAIKNEAKTVAELKKQNEALEKAKAKVNITTAAGQKQIESYNKKINENTEKIRANASAAEKQRMNIGNYPKVIANIKNATSGLATGMFPLLGAFNIFQTLLTGTEKAGEGFERITSSIGYSLKFLSDRLLTLNFSGLIRGFRLAWEEGKRYREELQRIEDAQTSLGIQEKVVQGIILDLELIAKSEKSTLEQREAAVKRIKELESDLREIRMKNSDDVLKNELENTAKLIFGDNAATEARKTLILGMVSDQGLFNDLIKEGAELQNRLNSLIKSELDNRGKLRVDMTAYNKAVSELSTQERTLLDINEISIKLTGEKREAISKARGESLDAINAEKQALLSLIKLENKLNKESIANDQELEDEREKAAKAERDRRASVTNFTMESIDLVTDKEIESMKLRDEVDAELYQDRMSRIEAEKQAKLQAAQEYVDMVANLGNTILEINQMALNNEIIAFENAKAYELQLAGDNAAQIDAVNAKYAKKEKELKTKQAKQNKAVALFNAIIGTAQAVISGLMTQPFMPLGLIMAALAGVLGGVQIGLIASQPIPQFAKGTKSAPRGLAMVGERGRELIFGPNGDVALSGNSAHMAYLSGGQQIIPNSETERILSAARGGYDSKELQVLISENRRNNQRLIDTIKNKSELHIEGSTGKITERKGHYYKTYLNRRVRGL